MEMQTDTECSAFKAVFLDTYGWEGEEHDTPDETDKVGTYFIAPPERTTHIVIRAPGK